MRSCSGNNEVFLRRLYPSPHNKEAYRVSVISLCNSTFGANNIAISCANPTNPEFVWGGVQILPGIQSLIGFFSLLPPSMSSCLPKNVTNILSTPLSKEILTSSGDEITCRSRSRPFNSWKIVRSVSSRLIFDARRKHDDQDNAVPRSSLNVGPYGSVYRIFCVQSTPMTINRLALKSMGNASITRPMNVMSPSSSTYFRLTVKCKPRASFKFITVYLISVKSGGLIARPMILAGGTSSSSIFAFNTIFSREHRSIAGVSFNLISPSKKSFCFTTNSRSCSKSIEGACTHPPLLRGNLKYWANSSVSIVADMRMIFVEP
uniref:CSON007295 protein n=1 Tax=Culicoides sonorensis TaxID=179676 RepID=A0A336LB85_CULSO